MSQNSRVQHTLMAYLRHELCTPITAMMGYSDMLLEELQDRPQTNLIADLHKIHDCSRQLLTLVNAILDPAQLELSQIDGDLSRFGSTLRMELLTPLSTIVGYCEMLLEEAPADAISDLDKINTAARQMLSLVNDIVSLAQQQLQTLTAPESSVPQLAIEHPATATLMQSATNTLETLAQRSPVPQVRGGTILAIDDNPTNCDLLARQLKRQGYLVTTATNASQALRLLKAIPFDLILIDAIMPGIDGLELLRQLKQDDSFKHIPAIVISALDPIDGAVRSIELGAEDYLQKPCDPILLKARIATCLEKKRLRDRELRYLQEVERLIAAAAAIETKTFNPNILNDLSQHPHKLGQLARVFQDMAREVNAREHLLEQQIQLLQTSISAVHKQGLVADIVATDHFQQLQKRTKSGSDIANLYRSSPYPSLHPAPPRRDRSLFPVVDSAEPTLLGETHAVGEQSETCRQTETSARFHPLRERVDPAAANSNANTGKIIAVHSFRGGTGKSNLTSNLAVSMAKQGKRVAIIDTDLQSPGIHVLFGLEDEQIVGVGGASASTEASAGREHRTLNDYLWERCALTDAAYDLSHLLPPPNGNTPTGALYLIPASAKANDITRILREGYHQERLLDGCSAIIHDLQLDFLLIDTHPGINEETLHAIAVCSLLVVVLRPDYQDYLGTAAIVELARMLSVAEMLMVVNKALPSFDVQTYRQQLETVYDVPVAGILPFAEEMMYLASSAVFSVRYPNHPLSQAVDRMSERIIQQGEISCPC
jgi:MinD-like ATPase involved in chromosome partitioning or flagellar assembly/DNA-binding response OmpR family regulator